MTSTLAERMRSAREARGWRVNELDRHAGKAKSGYASRIESGERTKVSPQILGAYARALGVNHEWLATGGGERQPASPDLLPPGGNVPRLRGLLALVAGDTDPEFVRLFWDQASGAENAEAVPALEWADRFTAAWHRANKPGPPVAGNGGFLPTKAEPYAGPNPDLADKLPAPPAEAAPAAKKAAK